MAHAFSPVSHALLLCESSHLIHLPASRGTCRLWDVHLTEEEQQEDVRVYSVKFSEDGSLLAVLRWANLEMWKTSTWERQWSVQFDGYLIDFSHGGLRVLVKDKYLNIHAYDVLSGDALGEIDSITNSMHDHVHTSWETIGGIWKCSECESSLLNNGEYWFTESDGWLWVVEEGVARRLIHILAEYDTRDIKVYSSYVAIGCWSGLLVLDTGRNSEVA